MIKLFNREIKKIYSSKLLEMKIKKPHSQRIVDKSKVKEIVIYQLDHIRKNKYPNFLGVINIHYLESDKEYYIVDGQHRYTAALDLFKNYSHDLELTVEIVRVRDIGEMIENYNLINKNTPLPEFPLDINRSIPEQTTIHFQEKYPDVWSDKSKARRPNVRFNSFQETLGCVSRELQGEIDSSVKMIKEVEKINEELSLWDREKFKNVSDSMYTKAKQINFFLGLLSYPSSTDKNCYEWGKMILDKKKNSPKGKKKTIPKKVKNDCWDTYIGKEYAEAYCIVCDRTKINCRNFQAGHIISEKHGGSINIDNILPVCGECNQSMGTINMREYVRERYPSNIGNFDKRIYRK